MKVLIVNKFLYPNGGSETYIFKIGEQLRAMCHEVQYFGMEHEGRVVGNDINSYTTDMDFHSGKLKKLLYPFSIIYSKEAQRKIRLVLDDFTPDVVHVNNFNFQLTPSILYEVRKYEKDTGHKVRLIYTAHDSQLVCPNHLMQPFLTKERCTKCIGGSPWNCAKLRCIHGSKVKSILGSIEAWIYRKKKTYGLFDTVICPSLFIKEKLDSLEEIREKTVVLKNFVEIPERENRGAECSSEGNPPEYCPKYFAYIGRFSEEKGIDTLLKVCRELPEVTFIFAGNGPLESDVNSASNILNKGFLTGEALDNVMRNAIAVIFSSECNENCPFTVMEALSKGVPVIGTNIGGVPELIDDGQNGVLFEPRDKEALKNIIMDLWKDKNRVSKLAAGAAQTRFDTLSQYVETLIGYYRGN